MQVSVAPDVVALAPGDVVDVLVRVHNDGDDLCRPHLTVRGLDPDDFLTPEVVAVAPGEVMTAVVRMRVAEGSPSGDRRVAVAVTDVEGGQGQVNSTTILRVGARPDVSIEVDPAATTGRRGARAHTVLRNRSDRRLRVGLSANGDGVALRFRPADVTLDPGQALRVPTRIRPTRRRLFEEVRHGAVVTASGVGLPVATTLTFTQRPTVPRAGLRAVAALAALAVWVTASVAVFQRLDADPPVVDAAAVAGPVAPGPGVTSASLLTEPEPTGVRIPVVLRGTVEGPRTLEGSIVTAERVSFGDEGTTQGATKLVALAGVKLPKGVVLDQVSTTTDERGRFRIASGLVEDAFYRVTVSRAGFEVSSRIVATSAEARDIELVVLLDPAAGGMAGRVVDEAGAPIGEATVVVTDGTVSFTATTGTEGDGAGRWSLEGLATPADYQVIVTRRGYATQTLIVPLGGGETLSGVDATLPTALGSLRGRVTATDPDAGVVGVGAVDIALSGPESRTTTTLTGSAALTGSFDFPGLPFGEYQLTFTADGWRTQEALVVVGEGDVVFNTTLLRSTGIVQGYVRQEAVIDPGLGICRYPTLAQRASATPRACGGALVSLTSDDGDVFGTASATLGSPTEGFFRIDGVPAGEYTLRVSRPGYVDHVERVVVGPGAVLSIRGGGDLASTVDLADDPVVLVLAAAPANCSGTVEVTLRNARTGGAIAVDATDAISLPGVICEGGTAPEITRINGSNVYRIVGAPVGGPKVTVDLAGFEPIEAEVSVNATDVARLTVNLAPFTELTVTLVDAAGAPVAGAEVVVFPASGTPGSNADASAGVTTCTRTIEVAGAFAGTRTGLCATSGADGTVTFPNALGLGNWRVSTPVNTTLSDPARDFLPTVLPDVVAVTAADAGTPRSISATLQRTPSLTGRVFVFGGSTFVDGEEGLFGDALDAFPALDANGAGISITLFENGVKKKEGFPAGFTPRLTYTVSGEGEARTATYRIDRLRGDDDAVLRTYRIDAVVLDGSTARTFTIPAADLGGFVPDEVRADVDLRLREPERVPVTVLVTEEEALGAGIARRPIPDARVRITGAAGFDEQRPPVATTETCPGPTCPGFSDATAADIVDEEGLWLVTTADGTSRAVSDVFTAGADSSPLTIAARAAGYRTLDLSATPPVGQVTNATIGSTALTVEVTLPFETVTVSGKVAETVTLADSTTTRLRSSGTVVATTTVSGVGSATRTAAISEDGTYSLVLPVDYTWVLTTTATGYSEATSTVTTVAGTNVINEDLTIARISGLTVFGTVVRDGSLAFEVRAFADDGAADGGEPATASVSLPADSSGEYALDLAGNSLYRLEYFVDDGSTPVATRWVDTSVSPPGPVTVRIDQDLRSGAFVDLRVKIEAPGAAPLTGDLCEDITVLLEEGGPFKSLSRDGQRSQAGDNAKFEDGVCVVDFDGLLRRNVGTDVDLSLLENRFSISLSSMPNGYVVESVSPLTLTDIFLGDTLPTVHFELRADDVVVEVAVTNSSTPVTDATVEARRGDAAVPFTRKAADSNVYSAELPPGGAAWNIVVSRPGNATRTTTAEVMPRLGVLELVGVDLPPLTVTLTDPGIGIFSSKQTVTVTIADPAGEAGEAFELGAGVTVELIKNGVKECDDVLLAAASAATSHTVTIPGCKVDGVVGDNVLIAIVTFPNPLSSPIMRTSPGVTLVASLPGAPTVLSVISPSSGDLSVSWNAPGVAGSPGLTEYRLETREVVADADPEAGWTLASVQPEGTSTSVTIMGLTNGTEYQFRVAAVNAIGQGPFSDIAAGTPAAPSG